ncbi:MAG: DNA/RNA non-specific endonuclease [Kiritimatiellia bacterium]
MAANEKKTPSRKTSRQSPKRKGPDTPARRWARRASCAIVLLVPLVCLLGFWYVRHPADWLAEHDAVYTVPLRACGDRVAMLTDGLGWTGHDAVYESDDPAPENQIFFAGAPKRTGAPAPADIQVLNRGNFVVGWSPSLRHPVWTAYRLPGPGHFKMSKPPDFRKDLSVATSPTPGDYARSGYEKTPLVAPHAFATRFGPDELKKVFKMTTVAPFRPTLARGPWHEIEQRISDLWSARYGELWIVSGAISSTGNRTTLAGTSIDVPDKYYMIVTAQAADGVRVLAVVLPQTADRDLFPTHAIVTIDELEEMTGLDFFPEMPKYLQKPLEADKPTRLWPIRFRDLFKLLLIRFT